jgi:hypothetical protein
MDAAHSTLPSSLEHIATTAHNRQAALVQIAALVDWFEESLGEQNQVASVDRLPSKWQQVFELC